MGTMWHSLKRGLQDGAAIVFDKAEELTQVGRARLDVAAAKTRLSRLEGELGVETFRLLDADGGAAVGADAQVRSLCERIHEARTELAEAEGVYERLRRDLQAEAADDSPDRESPVGV